MFMPLGIPLQAGVTVFVMYLMQLINACLLCKFHTYQCKKDHMKRKSQIGDKSKKFSGESSHEKNMPEASLKKGVSKMPDSSASSVKIRHRYFTTASALHNGHDITKENNITTDLTKQDNFGPHEDESPKDLDCEVPITDCSEHSRPTIVQDGNSSGTPEHMVLGVNSSKHNDKFHLLCGAVPVVHDILSGIIDIVDWIAPLKVCIDGAGKEFHTALSQSEVNIQSTWHQDQFHLCTHLKSDENADLAINTEKEDTNLGDSYDEIISDEGVIQEVIEPNSTGEEHNRMFGTPRHDSQNSVLNTVVSPAKRAHKDAAAPENKVYTANLRRHYQLPTVSSTMKQVDRSYFQGLIIIISHL
jgi:hypothetical protein